MSQDLNLKHLVTAIAEHTTGKATYLNDSAITIIGTRIAFQGNLVQYGTTSFRYDTVKRLLLELFNDGLLSCSGETLGQIQSKYTQLGSAGYIDHRKKLKTIYYE